MLLKIIHSLILNSPFATKLYGRINFIAPSCEAIPEEVQVLGLDGLTDEIQAKMASFISSNQLY